MKAKLSSIILLFIACLFSSCGDPTAPEDLVEEDRYIEVFSELLIINQLNDNQLDSISTDYLKDQIFEEYGITREQFQKSHQYYQKQPDEHLVRIDRIKEMLTNQRDQFQERLNEDRKQLADSLVGNDSLSVSDPLMDATNPEVFNSDELFHNNN